MPTLILLGAGASFGSEPEGGNEAPPLGIDLFDRLCELGGFSSRIPADIKKAFTNGFEEGMGLFFERMEANLQTFQRELCLYLARFTPSKNSYYVQLLQLLRKRNVVFSSLNYDMMLEDAALMLGMSISYGLNRQHNTLRLVKPHGSVNFWPAVPHDMFGSISSIGSRAVFKGPMMVMNRERALERCAIDTSLSPAIATYARGKRVAICPDYVARQQLYFSNACATASRIIIIGVRVVPEDKHIWDELSKGVCDITYFGNENDEVELQEWVSQAGRVNVQFVKGYFREAIAHITWADWR